MPEGELAIVLHTHMPYVEGFGTWPFGEEWLWEAVATSYLPLLRVFDELAGARADGRIPLTMSLTPVLADQLEAPGVIERCLEFLREIRPASHTLDIQAARGMGDSAAVAELERSAAEYATAADQLERLGTEDGSLLAALGAHTTWTSAATHPVLPLLALTESIDLQLGTGIASHRRRFGTWEGGLWSPECAYAPWLNPHLSEHGVTHTCVELTTELGLGADANLAPIHSADGPVLVPVDRATIDLVWGAGGYPSCGPYRNHHRLTEHHHRVHANDGGPYDRGRAVAQAQSDATEFVDAVLERLAAAGGGLCVCALDTELLGHWWYEGPVWLRHVVDQARERGLAMAPLDLQTIARHRRGDPGSASGTTSWGTGNDLSTWSGPAVVDLAFEARTAELETFASARPGKRALRELMARQSSDWAFMVSREWAGEYPRLRASGHTAQLQMALSAAAGELAAELRNLAPDL